MARVNCRSHGDQERTMVCQHIVEGLTTRTRVGFFWSVEDPDASRPDAWCSACKERVKVTNGEWIGQALELAKPQVMCGICYDVAKLFHMGGNPWS